MKEIDEKYLKEIYLNILKAIIIVSYFLVLNMAYTNVNSEYMEIGIKCFTMLFLFIAIYIFERAYKKDDGKLAIQGIEILILAIYTLTTDHITNKFRFNFKSYSLVASYMYAIYFILKSIVVYTKGRKELVKNLSDIREIVKKDEPAKKEATKKKKEENQKQKTNIKNIKEDSIKKDNKKTTSVKNKKATKIEKVAKDNKIKTIEKKQESKTTTNTRKITIVDKEKTNTKGRKATNKKADAEEVKTENKPQKKETKKEVKIND